MTTLHALHNHILFQFIDRVTTVGTFEESQSQGGIIMIGDNDKSAKTSRWAKIISLGPKCSKVFTQPNCEILIENLRWTEGAKFNGETVWRTDENQILAYRIAQ